MKQETAVRSFKSKVSKVEKFEKNQKKRELKQLSKDKMPTEAYNSGGWST